MADRSMEDWVRRADSALYVAKSKGKNCVEVGRLVTIADDRAFCSPI